MKKHLYFFSFLSFLLKISAEEFTPCIRDDEELDECLKTVLQKLAGKISDGGIRELGLERLDPLEIPGMVFNYDSLSDIGGQMTIDDTVAKGLSNITINKVRSIIDKNLFSMDVQFVIPRIVLSGNFFMNGRVSLFPVSGKGRYNITTGEVSGVWKTRGIPVTISGVRYLRLVGFETEPNLTKFDLHAENIVKNNPKLSRMVIAFTTRFWSLLYHQTLPYFERNFNEMGKTVLNKILLTIPYDVLFPSKNKANT